MTNPFLESDIDIPMDASSGTHRYDGWKDTAQAFLSSAQKMDALAQTRLALVPLPMRAFFLPAFFLPERLNLNLVESQFRSAQNHSLEKAKAMLNEALASNPDAGVNAALNFGFFTHNLADADDERNLTLNRIHIDAVVEQFSSNNPESWPNLLLNCSHARVARSQSVSGIMEGFHRLASDCFRDNKGRARELKLIMNHDYRTDAEPSQAQGKSKPSIMLSAVFNNWNAFGNGATMLYRIHQLDAVYEQEKKGGYASQRERERAYLGEGFSSMSPASVMLAKLMLKLIAEHPEEIHIPTREDFEQAGELHKGKIYTGDMTDFLTGGRLAQAKKPITLRADADHILQHILPEGYSKGGNIVSDAVRFLMLDLQRPLDVSKEDSPCAFEQQGKPLTEKDVARLIFNLGILAINPAETPLNPYEEKLGMRRLMIASTRDAVIGHFMQRPEMSVIRGRRDGRQGFYEITPKAELESLGHDYFDALGRSRRHGGREDSGYVADPNKLETDSDDKRKIAHEVRSRLRVIHAACYNALGISDVRCVDEARGIYELEFSRGADRKRIEHISQQLQTMMMPQHRVTCSASENVCTVTVPPASDITAEGISRLHTSKTALANALKALAKPSRNQPADAPELFVSDQVYETLGIDAPYKESGRGIA